MCEMMKIMQENREVTCCLGSSANFRNSRLFLQSDVRYADANVVRVCTMTECFFVDKAFKLFFSEPTVTIFQDMIRVSTF